MFRCKAVLLAGVLTLLASPIASAGTLAGLGGYFEFAHGVAAPDGVCDNMLGLHFSVTSDSFDGLIAVDDQSYPFEGSGEASGCAFFEPIGGIAAIFSGSSTWQTSEGAIHADFVLVDFSVGIEGYYPAVVYIYIKGGTGMFASAKGFAIAEGVDLPFGGLDGPDVGGVAAEITSGWIWLKD